MNNRAPIRIQIAQRMAVILSAFAVILRTLAVILSAVRCVFAPRAVEGPAVAFAANIGSDFVLGLFFSAITSAAQQPNSASPAVPAPFVVIDRVVAVVNNHAIVASDIDDEIGFPFSIRISW